MSGRESLSIHIAALLWAGALFALDPEGAKRDDKGGDYAVVKVTDHAGIVRHEALPKDKINERRDSLMMAYDAAMKVYEIKSRGLSEQDAEAFVVKPAKPKVFLIGVGYSKEKATAKANDLQKEYMKKQRAGGLFSTE